MSSPRARVHAPAHAPRGPRGVWSAPGLWLLPPSAPLPPTHGGYVRRGRTYSQRQPPPPWGSAVGVASCGPYGPVVTHRPPALSGAGQGARIIYGRSGVAQGGPPTCVPHAIRRTSPGAPYCGSSCPPNRTPPAPRSPGGVAASSKERKKRTKKKKEILVFIVVV